jgi:membrane peptidoglycan carboxypeptidase
VIRAPHFVFYVKSILEQQYGIHQIEEGGFRVITSLNLEIQEKAEEILREELKKIKDLNITNGGVLITVPSTGEILAMVGSKDYFATTGAFNVTEAQRQPGSSIKPLMYSLALEKGYTAATIINDSPVVFNILGSELYAPVNYDNRFHGLIPLRYALANSYNVPAVKVLYTLGVDQFIKQAQKIGITTWNNPERYGLSLTLGGGEVKMTDMAVAFGVFANRGRKVNLNPLLKISDYRNNLLFQLDQENSKRVINEEIAFIISNILSDSFARRFAFGTLSSLDIPNFKVAVKTGTTNDKKDNWTIGYTPQFLTAVWVGNNDNSPMNPQLTSGITGAAPIWNKVMSHLLQRPDLKEMSIAPLPEDDFKEPENIVKKNCYFGRTEYFIKGTENTVSCRENLFKVSPTTSVSP